MCFTGSAAKAHKGCSRTAAARSTVAIPKRRRAAGALSEGISGSSATADTVLSLGARRKGSGDQRPSDTRVSRGCESQNWVYFDVERIRAHMSKNRSVELGNHFADFIERHVKEGRYGSTSDVVHAGLRLLEEY